MQNNFELQLAELFPDLWGNDSNSDTRCRNIPIGWQIIVIDALSEIRELSPNQKLSHIKAKAGQLLIYPAGVGPREHEKRIFGILRAAMMKSRNTPTELSESGL